mmetsp:Transcript_24542/g.46543  ORF Transcript_24542/g.46543 Transcript_24542/m.46543 type:complete len:482 (+) Transcript_24542:2159-3604(+)
MVAVAVLSLSAYSAVLFARVSRAAASCVVSSATSACAAARELPACLLSWVLVVSSARTTEASSLAFSMLVSAFATLASRSEQRLVMAARSVVLFLRFFRSSAASWVAPSSAFALAVASCVVAFNWRCKFGSSPSSRAQSRALASSSVFHFVISSCATRAASFALFTLSSYAWLLASSCVVSARSCSPSRARSACSAPTAANALSSARDLASIAFLSSALYSCSAAASMARRCDPPSASLSSRSLPVRAARASSVAARACASWRSRLEAVSTDLAPTSDICTSRSSRSLVAASSAPRSFAHSVDASNSLADVSLPFETVALAESSCVCRASLAEVMPASCDCTMSRSRSSWRQSLSRASSLAVRSIRVAASCPILSTLALRPSRSAVALASCAFNSWDSFCFACRSAADLPPAVLDRSRSFSAFESFLSMSLVVFSSCFSSSLTRSSAASVSARVLTRRTACSSSLVDFTFKLASAASMRDL